MPTRRSILEAAGGLLLGSVIREIRAVPPPARVLEIHSGYGQEADRVGHPPRPGALRFDYFTTQRQLAADAAGGAEVVSGHRGNREPARGSTDDAQLFGVIGSVPFASARKLPCPAMLERLREITAEAARRGRRVSRAPAVTDTTLRARPVDSR